jgi:hypothetical protein
MREPVVVVALNGTSFCKGSARLRAKVALESMALHFSRFRGKRDRGGEVPGPHHPGRLSP